LISYFEFRIFNFGFIYLKLAVIRRLFFFIKFEIENSKLKIRNKKSIFAGFSFFFKFEIENPTFEINNDSK